MTETEERYGEGRLLNLVNYGNYQNYQGSHNRHAGLPPAGVHILDPRLVLIDSLLLPSDNNCRAEKATGALEPTTDERRNGKQSLFRNKTVLDYGCNQGNVAVSLASDFDALRVVGSDVDVELIARCHSHLSFCQSRMKGDDLRYYPISSVLEHGHRRWPTPPEGEGEGEQGIGIHALPGNIASGAAEVLQAQSSDALPDTRDEDKQAHEQTFASREVSNEVGIRGSHLTATRLKRNHEFPFNVSFRCEDWGNPGAVQERSEPPDYDIILALSVLKWIHLRHLDLGIWIFFRRCHRELSSGGLLILEIQPWDSYRRAVKKLKQRDTSLLDSLKMHPGKDFHDMLTWFGFVLVKVWERGDEYGLARDIEVWRKK